MTTPLRPPATQVNLWGTVTQVSPLRVQLDGEPGALDVVTDTLVGGLRVGDRVWVQLTTNTDPIFAGRHMVVIGKSGGVEPYPVGAVYVTTDDTDPGTLFGGTWSQITDVFLLAAGSTYTAGDTGGEAEHTLTVAETPSHIHDVHVDTSGGYLSGAGSSPLSVDRASPFPGSGTTGTFSDRVGAPAGQTGPSFLVPTGGDDPHNNMPPYLVVYVWKRTA